MRTRSTIWIPDEPGGGRPLVDDRGHVANTIHRELTRHARLSHATRDLAGSPAFSALLLLTVLGWLAIGPFVGFSRAWELSATAGAPIIGLVLLVIIQHTQNRDDKAIHLKLNEVIRASEHASDCLIGIEDSPEVELSRLLSDYRRHAGGNGSDGWRRQLRHAEGNLGPDHGFVFRSPDGRLNARAQSLALFAKLVEAVDDPTWLHHLRRGDYSRWFREVVQDEALASTVALIEGPEGPPADDSRQQVISAITQRYPLFA